MSGVKEEPVEKIDWQQHQQRVNDFKHWSISGRIALQSEYEGGQADYVWKQAGDTDYDIRLQAPMGAGTTLIRGRFDGVTLQTSSGDMMFDTDVDKLVSEFNGWPLPVSGLHYWVRGLPSPDRRFKVAKWHANGLPYVIIQDGWRIEFLRHKKISGYLLPEKLFISRQRGDEIDVRLIIRQWSVDEVNAIQRSVENV